MMKKTFRLCALSAVVSFGVATAASAQLSSTAFDQTPTPPPAGSKVVDFDSPLPSGFQISSGANIVQGSASGQYQAPAGDTTKYLAVQGGTTTRITADKGYRSISFYWGSIDTYNTVQLFDTLGNLITSFTGSAISTATGDTVQGATNRYTTYTLDPASTIAGIGAIAFSSTSNAFELDNVSFNPASVPEPATMGLFAVGLAALGRRTMKKRAARAAA